MSTSPLFPIAISSQLDDTGVERVHVADLSITIRPTYTLPPPPARTIFAAIDNNLHMLSSVGGDSFAPTANTGLTIITSGVSVSVAGGRLYHMGGQGQARTSTDGSNFVEVTGLPTSFFNPGEGIVIKVGAEWQLYAQSRLFVSTDGVAFIERTIESGIVDYVSKPAVLGTTILGLATGNRFNRSLDSGVTWLVYQDTAFNSFGGITEILAIPEVGFLAVGISPSNALLLRFSPTGASGSWTTLTAPATYPLVGITRDPVTGRIFMVLRNNSSYTGDLWYNDNNGVGVWTQGASFPYGGANNSVTCNLLWYGNYLYVSAPQGGGVNTIHRCPYDGSAWTTVHYDTGADAINFLVGFPE